MQTKSYNTVDKSEWPRGEWDNEPDKVQWQDQATGLPCLVVRGLSGALCGYVGLLENHPYFKKDYNDVPADVHGGLTFADHCQETGSECEGICHAPDKGELDNVWWLGFDCAHAYDLCPSHRSLGLRILVSEHERYRNLAYVQAECASLAKQLQAAA